MDADANEPIGVVVRADHDGRLAIPDAEHDGLVHLVDERFHVRPGDRDDRQPCSGGAREREHLGSEGVFARRRIEAQEVRLAQRHGVAMGGRAAHPEPSGDLGKRAARTADGEEAEDVGGPRDRLYRGLRPVQLARPAWRDVFSHVGQWCSTTSTAASNVMRRSRKGATSRGEGARDARAEELQIRADDDVAEP